jgi:predicted XRE-type DNA-binding protein
VESKEREVGFDAREAENLWIRSAMMNALIAQLEKRKPTQGRAAKVLGVTQPRGVRPDAREDSPLLD